MQLNSVITFPKLTEFICRVTLVVFLSCIILFSQCINTLVIFPIPINAKITIHPILLFSL